MAYLDVAALIARLANAGGAGARTAANLPPDRLLEHAAAAEAEVVGTLTAAGLEVAAADDDPGVDGLFLTIVADIAGYTATLEYYGSQALEDRDPVALRYQRAQELLKKLAAGKLTIAGVTDASAGGVTGEPAIYQGGPAVGLTDEAPPPSYFNGGTVGPYPYGRWSW